ncbi:MAG: Lrp/AsnC family transcriptional regulator [Anaerolineae bacterium]|nr:Lrp/AsnC family transcriptional regulator [Anaerolineae bacterium]
MKKLLLDSGFDQLDLAILEELQHNGRISVADLARKIHLSQPAIHNRMKRLEREGIIQQYVALVDREAAGYDLMCFIRITIQPHSTENFCRAQTVINANPAVLECYRTTGTHDLVLKVVVSDHKALDKFIADHLMTLPGIDRIDTDMVLNEVKVTTALQLKKK